MNKKIFNKYIQKNKKKLSRKRGSELAETVLIMAISIVLVVSLFYPQIVAILTSAVSNLETWFNNAIGQIGVIG
jgi:hypothetical protein